MGLTRIDRLISQLDRAIEKALQGDDMGMVANLGRQQAALIKERKKPAPVKKTLRPGTPKAAAPAVTDLLRK